MSINPRCKFGLVFFLWVLLINGFSIFPIYGQPPLSFKNYSVDKGLSSNNIQSVFQDSRGLIWFGTQNGLNLFNGRTFKVYRNIEGDSTSISHNSIVDLEEDKNNNLWVATWGGGLSVYNFKHDKFTQIVKNSEGDEDISLSTNYVFSLFKDFKENIWISTINGLYLADVDNLTFKRYFHQPENPKSLSENRVCCVEQNHDGNLWVGTIGGELHLFDPIKETFELYQDTLNHQKMGSISSLYLDTQKKLWIGTWNGLGVLDLETRKFKQYWNNPKIAGSISNDQIWGITESNDGTIWIGTDKGLNLYNEKQDNFYSYYANYFDPKSIPSNSIKSLFKDNEGRIWVGTFEGGVSLYDKWFTQYLHLYPTTSSNSISHSNVSAVLQNKEGKIFVGTDGGGLNVLDLSKSTFEKYKHDPGDPNSISNDKIKDIFEDAQGRIWIGFWNGGLDQFDPVTGKSIHYKPNPKNQKSLSNNNVIGFQEDKNGDLWLATWGGGVNQFLRKKNEFRELKFTYNGLEDYSILTILIVSDSVILAGSHHGVLYEVNIKNSKFKQIDIQSSFSKKFPILSSFQDSQKNIWIGTEGNGLIKFDLAEKSAEAITKNNGLNSNIINGIIEDNNKNLWLSTFNGLSKINIQTGDIVNIPNNFSLQGVQFSTNSFELLKNGYLAVGGARGLNIFHPDSLDMRERKIPILLTDFLLFNKPVKPGEPNSPLKQVINETEEIILDHTQAIFSIKFIALAYARPDNLSYKYRLEGFIDESWQYVGNQTKATYTNLKPGEYKFSVTVEENENNLKSNIKSIRLIVLAPWWDSFLFKFIIIVLVLGLIILGFRVRIINIENQKKKLEKTVEERTKKIKDQTLELGNLNQELTLKNEELASKQEELNTQLEKLNLAYKNLKETQSQLVHSEKMASLGILTAGIAHEINNPINYIQSGILGLEKSITQLLRIIRKYDEIDFSNSMEKLAEISAMKEDSKFDMQVDLLQKVTENINIGARKTAEIVKELRVFARVENSTKEKADIHKGLDSTLKLLQNQYKYKIEIKKNYGKVPLVEGYPGKLNQVFLNLLMNAIQAIESNNGIITISTYLDKNMVCISIMDNGKGMDLETKKKIFEPFYSTKPEGKGMGLGLSISASIIEEHNGTIEVESTLGAGTEFKIRIPVV